MSSNRTSNTGPLGESAATPADEAAVLRKNEISSCFCDVPLDEIARGRDIDLDQNRADLGQLVKSTPDVPQDSVELVSYLVRRYHTAHRQELPELIALARRVEAIHADSSAGLAEMLEFARNELEDHMRKEEKIVFPAICSGFKGSLFLPIKVMRHEHDSHARIVDELRSRMCRHGPPGDERESWIGLYRGVHKFVTDLTEHIHIENNVLFPRFE